MSDAAAMVLVGVMAMMSLLGVVMLILMTAKALVKWMLK